MRKVMFWMLSIAAWGVAATILWLRRRFVGWLIARGESFFFERVARHEP